MSMDKDPPLRVVVGEDHPIFQAGVVQVLRTAGTDVVAVASDAEDLLRKVRAHLPQLVVVDIKMPPNRTDDGLRAAHELRLTHPQIAVLVLSQFLEDRYALELVADRPEGVGYLLKDKVADVGEFLEAVRRVARGGSAIDAAVVARLVGRRRRPDPISELTPRERDVLALIAEGRSNQGIAEQLVVTVSAVERHVTRIFTKLGLHDTDQNGHRRVHAVLRYLHYVSAEESDSLIEH
jgi:DNA-binding NarL/FixJ family response regulator